MLLGGNWAVVVTAFIIVLYIAQGGVMLSAVVHLSHVAGARWRTDIAPYAHQTVHLYPLALALLIILLAVPSATFPYYQMPAGSVHLNAWHNYAFLVSRELLLLLIIAAVHLGYVRASARHQHDDTAASRRTLTGFAAVLPFLYFIYGTLVAWDFEMTLVPGWHSPIYAPYFFVSNFHMFLGFFVFSMYMLRLTSNGARGLADQSFNYLAQMMLGLTLLWTYCFFAQFITIWYGALPHETHRLYVMMFIDGDIRNEPSQLAPLFWWFVALKSFIPFGLLIFSVFRRVPALVALVGVLILVGTCLERFTWIASAYPDWRIPLTAPLDVAVVMLVASLTVFVLRWAYDGHGGIPIPWQPSNSQ